MLYADPNTVEIDCPNEYGGIGNISFELGDSPGIWTGDIHLNSKARVFCSFHYPNLVFTWRTNMWETDEAWHNIPLPKELDNDPVGNANRKAAAIRQFIHKIKRQREV